MFTRKQMLELFNISMKEEDLHLTITESICVHILEDTHNTKQK